MTVLLQSHDDILTVGDDNKTRPHKKEMDKQTLVIQSHRSPLPYGWIQQCLESVEAWSEGNGYEYHYLGDELFDRVEDGLKQKIAKQRVITSDLARLLVIQEMLQAGYQRVIWLDADFLIFDPINFVLPCDDCAVGREVWVQKNKRGKLKVYKKVHNAFLMFCRGDSFLDFYVDTSKRLLIQNSGSMPMQFIGPKLLTAMHNVAILPVMESAAMLSPMVIKDLLLGQGAALELFSRNSSVSPAGANLCTSSCDSNEVSGFEMQQLIELLQVY
jgi:hypothetical protein